MSGTGKKTIVEFQDVVKTYGEGEALQYANNHVSFTIEEGEFVVILGQSGAEVNRIEYAWRHGSADIGKGSDRWGGSIRHER